MINTDGAINTVMFPVLSKCQDDRAKLISAYRRSLKTSCFIIFPMMIGLAMIAKPLIIVLLTEKWLPSVPFLIIVSLTCMTWPFSIKYQAFNAIERSDVSLKLNIVEKTIGILFMALSIKYGVYALVMSFFVSSVISVIIGAYVTKRIIGYTIKQHILDVFPSLFISLVMGAVVYNIDFSSIAVGIGLILQIVIGGITYATLAKILKLESFSYLLLIIKDINKGKRGLSGENSPH